MHVSLKTAALAFVVGVSAKYCDPDLSNLCFEEHTTDDGLTLRLAIPADPPEGFRTALQIVAPVETGWTGFSWGGGMTNVPLTVAWKNGENVTVSPRLASNYALPDTNPNATFTVLPGSGANETHWKAVVLCEGCSKWNNGVDVALNGSSTSVPFAYAVAAEAPASPEDPESSFSKHDETGGLSFNLKAAQAPRFDEVVDA